MIKKITYCLLLCLITKYTSTAQIIAVDPAYAMNLSHNQTNASWADTTDNGALVNNDSIYISSNLMPGDTITSTLNCSQFQTSVPDTSIIRGIKVTIIRKRDSSTTGNRIFDDLIQFRIGGTPMGENKANQINWTDTNTIITYGDTNDTWGINWSPNDFNMMDVSLDIRLAFIDTTGNDSATAFLDQVSVEIYYTNTPSVTPSTLFPTEEEINYLYPLNAEYSSYNIKDFGIGKIYNQEGRLVNELNIPSSWDGTDNSGNLLPMGLYYLITDNSVYPIMIIK